MWSAKNALRRTPVETTTSEDAPADSASVRGDENRRSRQSDQQPLAGTFQKPRRSRPRGHLRQVPISEPAGDHPPDAPCGIGHSSRVRTGPASAPLSHAEPSRRKPPAATPDRPARPAVPGRARRSSRNSLQPYPASPPKHTRSSTTPVEAGAAGTAAMIWRQGASDFKQSG